MEGQNKHFLRPVGTLNGQISLDNNTYFLNVFQALHQLIGVFARKHQLRRFQQRQRIQKHQHLKTETKTTSLSSCRFNGENNIKYST